MNKNHSAVALHTRET